MQRLQNTDRVWWYIQREAQDVLGRPMTTDECVTAVVIVAGLTKMLTEEEDSPAPAQRRTSIDLDAPRVASSRR